MQLCVHEAVVDSGQPVASTCIYDVLDATAHVTTLITPRSNPPPLARVRSMPPSIVQLLSLKAKGTALHFWAWGTEQPRLKCHSPEKLGPLAVSCDGSLCAGGGISGRVYVWEVSSGTLLRAWDAHYKVWFEI